VQLITFDDFHDPTSCSGGGLRDARPLIAGVGEDTQDEWKQRSRPRIENECRAVAILDIGGMNGNAQQEAERIDEDVPLAAGDFLARVVT